MDHTGAGIGRSSKLTRRHVLLGAGAALAAAGTEPRRAAAQARKGEIVAGLSERMLTLDPANHYSISATSVLRHIYDPLVEVTNDSKFVPCLAEAWTPVNNTTWRFTLRKGVKFHDGSPFTADSVIYSLKRVRDNTKLIKAFVYQDIEDVRKEGDSTVIVTTKRAFGSLPAHLTMLGMLPQAAAQNEDAFFQKPIGTGPFKFAGWTHGEQISLVANADYWKPGIPKVEKVTFRFIPELSTRVAALRRRVSGSSTRRPSKPSAGSSSWPRTRSRIPASGGQSRSPSIGTSSSRIFSSDTRVRW
jgi:peptide/nickel transport system substrate-binding protein